MSEYREIFGQYRKFYSDEPLTNATINFKLSQNSFTLTASYPSTQMGANAQTDAGWNVTTDNDGNLPADFKLFTNSQTIGAVTKYLVTDPDGFKWEFILSPGDLSPISIQELRAGGSPVASPDTIISLIENTDLGDLHDVDFEDLQDGDVPVWNDALGKWINGQIAGGSGGGVTSVALALPASLFNVTGSPITTNGTLTGSLKSQTQNQVFAAPDGADGVPAFRLLAAADIPNLAASKITSGTFGTTRLADNSVTFAKLQNIATARLLGRSTAATGSVEEISIGSGLSLAGGVLSASGGGGGGVDGSGTAGYLSKFSDADTLTNSAITEAEAGFIKLMDKSLKLKDVSNTGEESTLGQYYGLHLRSDRATITFGSLGEQSSINFKVSRTNYLVTGSRIDIDCALPNYGGVEIKAAASQSEKLITFKNSSNAFIGGFAGNGAFLPASLNDSDAPNSSLYYSLDSDRLTYKDDGGTPHSLW